jgi:uncharacterized protein (DUF934 family)
MPLVKGNAIVADEFAHVADEDPISDGAVLLPAARFLVDPEGLLKRNSKVGVIWPNNKNVADLKPYLDRLAAIVLVFPIFRDGRAYSQARLLRERFGFRGELRASGQVLRDQFVFMLRSGFDAFDVKKASDAAAFAEVTKRYTVVYQPAGDVRETAAEQRQSHYAEGARSS